MENDFINKLKEIIEVNIANEQFGVSELASDIGISRSNLLRKVKKLTNLSVSQFIREVRLQHAMGLLKQSSSTISEISYQVGFSSTSYFIKCFRDYYGYPPGEAGKRDLNQGGSYQVGQSGRVHQLVAIMFTDIQGYTALMQQDERKAIEILNRHREVFNTVTEKFKGKILQYFGDGTLSTFNSAIDAVRCGIEMQLAFQLEPHVPVRIGIHSGDILFNEDGIVGDGVNVASRIESLAAVGSVFISEKVFDEVKNQSGIQTTSMGEFELKNVEKSVEVFAIANEGLVVPESGQIEGKVKRELPGNRPRMKARKNWSGILWVLLPLTAIVLGYFIYTSDLVKSRIYPDPRTDETITIKSIAVLPFINDSNDSTNVYLINGLMESTLNNLQKIKDLRVISRTSVEKYRNNPKTIPEIARELNVHYLIEGSGQKIGDQIMLNIQLIEASSDKHLWSEQYNRDAKDIFNLQKEVAQNIAKEIEVIITPEEEQRINKVPTKDLLAYDYFLKGLDLLYTRTPENLQEAIRNFEKAVEHDKEFARAYAGISISYFLLDAFQAEKKYSDQINLYADQALLYDAQLPQSLIAKALYYIQIGANKQALPHLEKALEYNPNSAQVINILSDFYANLIPNTEKYLEYALKGIQLDIASHDSTTASFIYMHVSNAFLQSGFIDEAEMYIEKSLDYNPENIFSEIIKAYILFAKNGDLNQTKEQLVQTLKKDSTRLDVVQEIGKMYYYMGDYESAYQYYKRFVEVRNNYNLDIYRYENDKIGVVYSKMGLEEQSERFFNDFVEYTKADKSYNKHLNLSMFYSYEGKTKEALEQLRLFSQKDNYDLWVILFVKIDPLIDNIKELPEFRKIFSEIESKFWSNHKRIKASLREQALI